MEIILPIVKILVVLLCGYVYTYISTKTNIASKIATVISKAETEYKDAQKSGSEKMNYAIDLLYQYVPVYIKPILTKEVLKSLVQAGFEQIQEYANAQLDKVVSKIDDATSEKEETADADTSTEITES